MTEAGPEAIPAATALPAEVAIPTAMNDKPLEFTVELLIGKDDMSFSFTVL